MSGQNMRGCGKFDGLLEDYLGGDLPRLAADRLSAHLGECLDCKQALDDAHLSARLVSVFDPAVEPGPSFTHLVMAQVDGAESQVRQQRSFWRPLEAMAWRLAFSAALVLALLFTYGLRANVPAPEPTVATALGQQSDVFTVPARAVPSSGDQVLMAIAEKHHEQQ